MTQTFYTRRTIVVPFEQNGSRAAISRRIDPPFTFTEESLPARPGANKRAWIESRLRKGDIAEFPTNPTNEQMLDLMAHGFRNFRQIQNLADAQTRAEAEAPSPTPQAVGPAENVRLVSDEVLAGSSEDELRTEFHRIRPDWSAQQLAELDKDQLVELGRTLMGPAKAVTPGS